MNNELKNARDALARVAFDGAPVRLFDDMAHIQIAQSALLIAIADRLTNIYTMCGAIRADSFRTALGAVFNIDEYPCILGSHHTGTHADRDGDTWDREE